MNKKIAGTIGAVLLAAGAIVATPSELSQSKEAIASDVSSRIQSIDAFQSEYRGQNSRFLQSAKAVYTTKSGQPYTLTVNEYDGPKGKGYEIYLRFKIGDDEYEKIIDKGLEGRTKDWVKIPKHTVK